MTDAHDRVVMDPMRSLSWAKNVQGAVRNAVGILWRDLR